MSGVQPRFGYPGLRISYTCAEAVVGGQLVSLSGDREVSVAGAGDRACGVALFDVPATRATPDGPKVGDGNELSVATDCVVELTASGAVNAGDAVVTGADGKVVADNSPALEAFVGFALEDIASGETGLVRVRV